ncbi:hypothetical protein RHGRI_010155 [Rhododendron griersonianum]|uniref:Cysteine-rich transmembrane domain-containing protein n=1 Tax=Rhododendron griersonianum TaxID=479676 RepID=A0AAV6KI55_9ERIC|nr:hypothetical protein RHGRI_010155 [Rhododendron griersonianum]
MSSQLNQNQPQGYVLWNFLLKLCAVAYPAPGYAAASVQFTAPVPPAGYPRRDGQPEPQNPVPAATRAREDGFWKGCCAALCCCCVLDACF